jgi:uncharacterized protein YjiS (DUF1127 family)
MNILKRIFKQKNRKSRDERQPLHQLSAHTLRDIGVDPRAAEHRRNERLWRELAS